MSRLFSLKKCFFIWLLGTTLLLIYASKPAAFLFENFPFAKSVLIKTFAPHNGPYHYDNGQPLNLSGYLKIPEPDYVHLNFNFKISKNTNLMNVFQTGPGNQGVRLEIVDNSAILIIFDSEQTSKLYSIKVIESIAENS